MILILKEPEVFDFLGWNFRKYKNKLLTKPSKKSIKRFTETISQTLRKGMAWSQDNLISKLNPIIKGWSNYHNSVVSSETFQTLDHRIWEMLWRWAKRRHPNKSKNWIVNKYWKQSSTRKWNFRTERNSLLLLSKTKILRHIPLKLQMNTFLNLDYFCERHNKLSSRKSQSIWKKLLLDTEKVIERLSRMKGNFQVRFLEERERVIALSYSTFCYFS